jgi:DNA-directed RNA polymerase subunit RPC12/RpoP
MFGSKESQAKRAENRAESKRIRQELGIGIFDNVGGMNQSLLTLVKNYSGGNITGPQGPFSRDAGKLANHGWSLASQSQGKNRITATYVRPNTLVAASTPSWYSHPSQQSNESGATSLILCASCGAKFDVPAAETGYTCPTCSYSVRLALCPRCAKLVRIPADLSGNAIKCGECGTAKPWTEWEKRPVTVAQYADLLAPSLREAPTSPLPSVASSMADEVAKLAKLRDDGVLSDTEFASAKARLLSV